MMMHVAVLGGGLQGCCCALALAERGVRVTLFDRNEELLTRAAVANEGKIHLGYLYAGDLTLSTARTMMRGALAFAPFLHRHVGSAAGLLATSQPATYLVHRHSQLTSEAIAHYLTAVHALVRDCAQDAPRAYFGIDLDRNLRRWGPRELQQEFNPTAILDAFDTPEIAIDPAALAGLVRAAIAAHSRIEVRLRETVVGAEEDHERLGVVTEGGERSRYDHVINALWDGRLAVDASLGHRPGRPWLHRLKYGVSFKRRSGKAAARSVTVVLGPFGEVVNYAGGTTYLTWYPDCLRGMSGALKPPSEWAPYPDEPLRSQIRDGTFAALSQLVFALGEVDDMSDILVRGGVIFAWGATNIDDPHSELHHRFEIGVTSIGRFHSVDPGKLTMAPYFADVCAERIVC